MWHKKCSEWWTLTIFPPTVRPVIRKLSRRRHRGRRSSVRLALPVNLLCPCHPRCAPRHLASHRSTLASPPTQARCRIRCQEVESGRAGQQQGRQGPRSSLLEGSGQSAHLCHCPRRTQDQVGNGAGHPRRWDRGPARIQVLGPAEAVREEVGHTHGQASSAACSSGCSCSRRDSQKGRQCEGQRQCERKRLQGASCCHECKR